ncbi:ATP-dependent permease [Polyrhizophydium stewartii]|uniref:ATP-dependent permease n=1 Tax=Polyrhizophydium stewartii TaxID=2732419 RepID=A0ABR4NIN3_9FUNG
MLAAAALVSVLEGSVQPMRNLLLGLFTETFSAFATTHDAAAFTAALHGLLVYAAVLAAAAWLLSFAQSFVFKLIAQLEVQSLRRRYMAALTTSDPEWRRANPSTQLVHNMNNEIDRVEAVIADKVPWVVRNLAVCLLGMALALRSSVALSLAILAVFPLAGGVLGYMHHNSGIYDRKLAESYRGAGQVAHEVLMAIKTVMAFNRQSAEAERYSERLESAASTRRAVAVFSGIGWGMYSLTMFLAFAVSFFVGGRLVASGSITPGDVLNTFTQIAVGITAIGNIGQASRDIQYALHVLTTLADQIEELRREAYEREGVQPMGFLGHIEFRNVWFRYPSRINRWVLQDVSLEIQPGEHVALVGQSGCGKSTILHLLTGLYAPESGKILIDGTDINGISLDWLRAHFGIASQSAELFDGTLRQNVALGAHRNSSSVPMSVIKRMCELSQASEFIGSLEGGYDAQVSGVHTSLSGGQIQRIAIARALLGAEDGFLILDEATSALDAQTEHTVLGNILRERAGKTVLCISHRVASLSSFSRIIVLKDGSIAEDGTFAQLAAAPSLFSGFLEHHDRTQSTPSTSSGKADSKNGAASDSAGAASAPSVNAAASKADVRVSLSDAAVQDPAKPDVPDDWRTRLARSKKFFRRVWTLTHAEWKFLLLGYLGGTLEGLQAPMQGFVIGKVVAGYALPTGGEITASTNFWALMILLIGVISLAAAVMNATGFGFAESRNMTKLRRKLFSHIVFQDMAFFSRPANSPTNLGIALSENSEKIGVVSGNLFADIMRSTMNLGAGMYIGLTNSWHMAVVMVLPLPLIVVIGAAQARLSESFARAHQQRLQEATRFTSEVITKLQTITLLGKQRHFEMQYDRILSDFARSNARHQFVVSLGQGLVESLIIVVFSLGLYAGGTIMLRGWATNEQVLVALVTITLTAISANQLLNSVAYALGPAAVAVQTVFDILDSTPTIRALPTSARSHAATADAGRRPFGGVRVSDVTFSYSGSLDAPAIVDISVEVAPGQKVALVGPTGSGKSSVLGLVQRFYDPQRGSVTMDRKDLRDWDVAELRSRIGVVPQFPDLFDTSVRANIAYGRPDASIEDIEGAARMASAHDFIVGLPDGYDTRVGERGSLLSGGQRQRLAIARLYLLDPSLIVLDEATSALDTENEGTVISALESHARERGKGLLVVTHRLETIRDADCIHVLTGGRVVASGTHAELLRTSPDYADLAAAGSRPAE